MPEVVECINTSKCAILNGMDQHYENVYMLQFMLSVLRERQSAWELTPQEKVESAKGIEALEAAVAALSIQVYA